MKIAVDCHPLVGNKSGVGNYLFSLLSNLVLLRPSDHFYLYSPKNSNDIEQLSKNFNVTVRICKLFSKSSLIWGQTTLLWHICMDKVDLIWEPNHLAPVFTPKKIKQLITIHDFVFKLHPETLTYFRRTASSLLSRMIFKNKNHFITVSIGTNEKLKKNYGLQVDSIINPPMREHLFRLDQVEYDLFFSDKYLKQKQYLLFLGTLEPRKNLHSILLTYKNALIKYGEENTYPLVLIGSRGWKNNRITNLLNELQLVYPNRIFTLGFLSDDQLTYYIKGARYLLLPSLYEGYGMPIAEARCLDTPVITSNLEELIEAAEGDGIFLNPYNLQTELMPYFEINNSFVPKCNKQINYQNTWELSDKLSKCIDGVFLK